MAVVNGEVIKAAAQFILGDDTIVQNVFKFIAVFAAEHTGSEVRDAIQTYVEDLYTPILAYISSGVTVDPTEVDVVKWDATEGDWVVDRSLGITTPSLTFTGAAEALPNQVAGVLVANTLRPKTRGRKFLIPFTEGATSGSDIGSAVLTALATSLAHYIADETVSGTDVLSPGVWREGVNDFQEFTDGVVNTTVGTQRRRSRGIGI